MDQIESGTLDADSPWVEIAVDGQPENKGVVSYWLACKYWDREVCDDFQKMLGHYKNGKWYCWVFLDGKQKEVEMEPKWDVRFYADLPDDPKVGE